MQRRVTTRRPDWRHGVVLVLALAALGAGWRAFWFLTDDAYIQFRYVSNAVLGHGYVWNPPPFHAVEGYTSFLWVALLEAVWRVTGVEPPESANWLSLGCAALTVLLTGWMVLGLRLRPALEPWRAGFLALALAGVLTNRTFLAWTSSGLETALFGLLVLTWVHAALRLAATRAPAQLFLLSAAVALIALTRPDGYLFAASTLVIALAWVAQRRRAGALAARDLLALLPLVLIAAHVLWRRSFYGEWLPNTYYAKHLGAWPEAGARYALSFALEYALWAWALLVVAVGLRLLPRLSGAGLARVLAVLTVAAHAGYYTFVIGGDHFEYRVYAHLVPLIWLSSLWLVDRSGLGRRAAAGVLAALVALSLPIPWLHRARSLALVPETGRFDQLVSVADGLPGPARWYGELFDRQQRWLSDRFVCVRHLQHRTFWRYQLAHYPPRAEGAALGSAGDRPVFPCLSVGVPGWCLPHVAIVDTKGLNDRVVARAPTPPRPMRRMAHERHAPMAYLATLSPNVTRVATEPFVRVRPREFELTDGEIVAREAEWWRRARQWQRAPDRPSPPAQSLLLIELGAPGFEGLETLGADGFVFRDAELGPAGLAREAGALAARLGERGATTAAFVAGDPLGSDAVRGFDEVSGDPGAAAGWLAERADEPFVLFLRGGPELGAVAAALLAAADESVVAIVATRPEPPEPARLAPRLAPFERELAATFHLRVPTSSFASVWCTGDMPYPVHGADLVPTALEALGLGTDGAAGEGRSLFAEMACGLPADDSRFSLHPELGFFAVRRGGLALFLAEDGETWLYDLRADPPRRIDAERPALAARLEAALRQRIGR